jgi:hypothetical protein
MQSKCCLENAVKQIIEKLPKTAPWSKISNEDLLNHLGDLTEHWIRSWNAGSWRILIFPKSNS